MALQVVQKASLAGLNPAYTAAAAGGDAVPNDGKTVLKVKNADAVAHTVTIASQVSPVPVGTAKANVVVAVPAGDERVIGPFDKVAFNDADGNLEVTYDAANSVTIAAVSIG